MKKLFYVLVVLSMLLAFSVSALPLVTFQFYGYAYNVTQGGIENTNVSLIAYDMTQTNGPPNVTGTYSGSTNGSGFFNFSVDSNENWSYKPVIRHFNGANVDYIGSSLPQLPYDQIQRLSPIDFYLKEGATINITAQGREQASGSVDELGSWNANDYLLGLEWDNDNQLWAYLNTSYFLVKLNPGFTFSTSYQMTISGIMDVEYVSPGFWYFANSTTVLKYYENVIAGNLTLEAGFPITCDGGGPCNYITLSSLEYDEENIEFYVMARVSGGNSSVDRFNMSFARQNSVTMPDYAPGELAFSNGNWFIGFNNSGQYRIEPCYLINGFDCKGDEYWNVSGSIEGLENNGTGSRDSWLYASATKQNITQIELLYTTEKNFNYMVKDVKLGYPIAEEFDSSGSQATIYVPADRNYSIMIYPDMSFPVSYDLNNISDYDSPKHVDIMFNTTEQWRWVSGYALFGGSADFEEFNIIAYLIEPGNMIGQGHPLPYNMSAWRDTSTTDVFNSSTGFYNITLPGSMMTTDIMLFAVTNKSDNTYYGAFRNISLNFSDASVADFNFTLYTLPGTESVITLQGNEDKNITVKKVSVQVNNESGGPISDNAFTETIVDYTSIGGPSFSWMQDVDSDDNGIFMIPLLAADVGVEKMNIYSKNNAPKKTSFTAVEVATGALEVNLSPQFQPKNPEGEEFMDLFIDMVKSTPECDVPDYNRGACSLFPQGEEKNMSNFDPFKIVMGGGKISFVMRKDSNNITVHYKNVDMMASGPPDALFDESAHNQTEQGSSLEMAWRFGSEGPEIYDEVLIGIPIDDNVDLSAPVNLLLSNLYDDDWNAVWNVDANTTAQIPEDYQDFNLTWFNTTTNGMPCSTSDNTAQCYINNGTRMVWLTIPHFSGIGPTVQSVSLGGVNITADEDDYDCTNSCVVYLNVTNENYTISQSLHNISLATLATNGSLIANVSIYWYNNSAFVLNGTNSSSQRDYNLTLSNGSATTLHRYRLNVTKQANQSTTLNITYNITDLNLSLGLSLALNCVEDWTCTDWSTCSGSTQTRTCTEGHSCGTTDDKLAESQSCTLGGGGGGGGGGILNPSNSETWTQITPGAATIMKITNAELGIKQIIIEVNNPANNVKITVTKLPGKPASVTKNISGKVYKYLEIRKENLNDTNLKGGVIKISFQVPQSWLLSSKVEAKNIVLKRFTANEWQELKTSLLSQDSKNAYYETETPGMSYFAIAEKSAAPTPAKVEPTPAPAEEPVITTPPAEKPAAAEEKPPVTTQKQGEMSVGLQILLVLVIFVAVALVIISTMRKRRGGGGLKPIQEFKG
jgi:PGF-pre-PGF domain-containing protein